MKNFAFRRVLAAGVGASALCGVLSGPAFAIELKDAVQIAVDSNPQVNQAIQDKQAIEFERKQAQGLYLPRLDLEASGGVERLSNPTRREIGLNDETLYPVEGGLTLQQTIFDSGNRRSELQRQAARTDGAATRVGERSEFIALETTREYLNYMLQQRIVAAAQDNVTYHEKMVSDLSEGVSRGSISVADQQQAQERLQAARARVIEAREGLVNAMIAFTTRTGVPLDQVAMPPELAMPATLDEAVGLARENNPTVKIAMSDVDAARAVVRKSKSELGPKIALEARGRIGDDVDGFAGRTEDVQARVVLRWNLYSGGINQANVQEQVRRASEERYRLHQTTRQAEEDVRTAWNRREQQASLTTELDQQVKASTQLLGSYGEQFKVGRRSLLDLLDTQNTLYNSQVLLETARFAEIFARYKLLAATGQLLDEMGIQRPKDAAADARHRFNVPETPPAETMSRRRPG
jgi:adhesin transport system outer membrane protein